MPYTVRKGKGTKTYKILKKDSGRQVGSSKIRKMAEASVRARHAGDR